MITVSKEAAKQIKSSLKKRGEGLGARLSVINSGCNGLSYKLEYLDELENEYLVLEKDGIYLSIEKDSYHYLKGVHIDFIKHGLGEGFVFTNPNETGACGCGETFSVD